MRARLVLARLVVEKAKRAAALAARRKAFIDAYLDAYVSAGSDPARRKVLIEHIIATAATCDGIDSGNWALTRHGCIGSRAAQESAPGCK